MCAKIHVFCVCVCVQASVCMHLLSLGYLILRSWHTFPASTDWICFCPSASRLPRFLSKKGGRFIEECVFSSRLTLHEYFKQATWFLSATRPRGETCGWAGGKSEQRWNVRLELGFQTPPAHGDGESRQSLGEGGGWVKPYLTMSACIVPGLPVEFTSLLKTISTGPGMCLHCWLSVVCVWMERMGESVDIPGIPRRQ